VDETSRLAQAAAGGDRLALHGFVRATQSDLWRWCAYLVGPDDAPDLTQEVYIRAFRALPRYRAEANARTWLFAIARRAAVDHIRLQRLRRRPGLSPPLHVPSPEAEVTIAAAVSRLEPQRRAAFVLTQILGLSYAEAAQVCRCPIGTVRSRVARARQDLITALAVSDEQQDGSD
jgi:RNA polymerase sigma-70 factor (ECF subfamily)